MKALFCYYSTTGNTKLALEYIARHLVGISCDFFDVTTGGRPELKGYNLIGLATFADFLKPPQRMIDFMKSLPRQKGKAAFVFNTYGGFNGRTLLCLHKLARRKGFRVVAGFALNTPENHPAMIQMGTSNLDRPLPQQMEAFQEFGAALKELVAELGKGAEIKSLPLRVGLKDRFAPVIPRKMSAWLMGQKQVDAALCTKCGLCAKKCAYGAIHLAPLPIFDQKKCYGCWACYNHCPAKAIYTRKLRGECHYPKPAEELKGKLK
jgi:ferredoxin